MPDRLWYTDSWKSLKTKKRTVIVRKLKTGKKYQVRIRACKKVGNKVYYGAWSRIRTTPAAIR